MPRRKASNTEELAVKKSEVVEEIIEQAVEKQEKVEGSKPYKVRVKSKKLRIRERPDTNSTVIDYLNDQNEATIVEEHNGFGKLLSGIGWVMLEYTKKI